jgi:hypothetical protein
MPKPNTSEICRIHLFDDVEKLQNAGLSFQLQEKVKRIRAIYTIYIQYPLKKEKEICDMMMLQFKIDRSTVYEDIKLAKQLIGDFATSSKPWHRFKLNAMLDKAYDMAVKKQNPIAVSMVADKYGKYNQLDKEESERYPWEEIAVQQFEITSDPTVIGIQPVPNIKEKIAKMKDKYFGEIQDIEYVDVTIEDIFKNTPTELPSNE